MAHGKKRSTRRPGRQHRFQHVFDHSISARKSRSRASNATRMELEQALLATRAARLERLREVNEARKRLLRQDLELSDRGRECEPGYSRERELEIQLAILKELNIPRR